MKNIFFAFLISVLAVVGAADVSPNSNNSDDQRSLAVANGPLVQCGAAGGEWYITNKANCDADTGEVVCIAGWGGKYCQEDVDECATNNPCPVNGFCVDYDPPYKWKCGCSKSFVPILPSEWDDKSMIPVEWRPLACIASPTSQAPTTNTPAPVETEAPASPTNVAGVVESTPECTSNSNCNEANGFVCNEGKCICRAGMFNLNGRCRDEDECRAGYPNDCHKYATCINEVNGYRCSCDNGYEDARPTDKPGTTCKNRNECEAGGEGDIQCAAMGKVCVDRVPGVNWQCIDPTPAPTPLPTNAPTSPIIAAPRPTVAPVPLVASKCAVKSGNALACGYFPVNAAACAGFHDACIAHCNAITGCFGTFLTSTYCYIYYQSGQVDLPDGSKSCPDLDVQCPIRLVTLSAPNSADADAAKLELVVEPCGCKSQCYVKG